VLLWQLFLLQLRSGVLPQKALKHRKNTKNSDSVLLWQLFLLLLRSGVLPQKALKHRKNTKTVILCFYGNYYNFYIAPGSYCSSFAVTLPGEYETHLLN
jgi:hypothetical protein